MQSRRLRFLYCSILTLCLISGCGRATPVEQQARPSPAATEDAPLPATTPVTTSNGTTPATTEPVADAAAPTKLVWLCAFCPGREVWVLEGGEAQLVPLPVEIGQFLDYSPERDQILYASHFPTHGAGPNQIAVSDLWLLDMQSGQTEPIFQDDVVIEAVWVPGGEQIVYAAATDTSYELRLHSLNGEERVLASDVAFTFSVSPQGNQVAFTRESAYGSSITPGLYVVDLSTGEEWQVSDEDRAGTGAMEDRPIWSPSGDAILLPLTGMGPTPSVVVAAADGSKSDMLQFDPSLSDQPWYEQLPSNIIWADADLLLGTVFLSTENPGLGGDPYIVVYRLDEERNTIVQGTLVAEGVLIGVNVPGESVWVQIGPEIQSVMLPTE